MNSFTDNFDRGSTFEESNRKYEKKDPIKSSVEIPITSLLPTIDEDLPAIKVWKVSSEKSVKVAISAGVDNEKEFIRKLNAKIQKRILPPKFITE